SLVNRAQGLIATPGTLLLRQLGVVDNSGGEISSDRAFTLATSALNNQGGRLLSGGALTLRIAQALDNSLEGIVSGAGGLDIQAFVLDNRSGSIGSKGAIDNIGVTRLENDAGTLIAERGLKLAADEANSSKGRIAANGSLHAKVGTLSQKGGELTSQDSLTLDLGILN
ncbi:hypothetical protein, partial [Pseudomonas aeruginosa]|uniref:hypothetical protein n=1 Tax=Pseudomonas aeruginosa TaxID=287 RepID=UPI001EDAA221